MKELTPLFKALRAAGFDARQRFTCCSSCAGAQIATEYRERLLKNPEDKKLKSLGFVFNHAQDQYTEQELDRMAYRGETVEVPLRYGPVEVTGDGFNFNGPPVPPLRTVGLSTKEIGDRVVEVCKQVGMEYVWDGNPDTVIYVLPFGKAKPEESPMMQQQRERARRERELRELERAQAKAEAEAFAGSGI